MVQLRKINRKIIFSCQSHLLPDMSNLDQQQEMEEAMTYVPDLSYTVALMVCVSYLTF